MYQLELFHAGRSSFDAPPAIENVGCIERRSDEFQPAWGLRVPTTRVVAKVYIIEEQT
jgi:hypothetical protein